jgi:cytochrome P450
VSAASTSLPPGPRDPFMALQVARLLLQRDAYLGDLRRRYGDVFSLRVPGIGNVVVVSEPELIRQVLTGDPTVLEAGEGNEPLAVVLGSRSLLLLDGAEHLSQRKLMLPPFHGANLERYRGLMGQLADEALDAWPVRRPFAMLPRMQALTLEIIMRVVFDIQDRERLAELRPLLRRVLALVTSHQAIPRYVFRRAGGMRTWRAFHRAVAAADEVLLAEIARRRADPELEQRSDIVAMLLRARDEDGRGMGDVALRDQLMTLLMAGHETTATALAWTFERLLRHPDALARLTAEARDGEDDAFAGAVVTEALRARPPIPFIARRLTAPFELGGYVIPPRTRIVPMILTVHHRRDLYPKPGTFQPERFLDARPDTYGWLPFGGGIRRCVGASFAMLEMKVVLHTVLRRGRFEAVSPRSERGMLHAIFFRPTRGGRVVLAERAPARRRAARRSAPEKCPVHSGAP